jgi:CheY-like chemotaxis protein
MKNHFNILIIDDEEVVINSLSKIASLDDYTVDAVTDARKALNQISINEYDLIICDIMLPEMDGFQFLTTIESQHDDTPVIMTTGYSTIENAVKSLYTGAIDFIPKPFTIDEMTSAIHRGMKYSLMMKKKKLDADSVLIVTCPAKYLRLGYSSWMFKDLDGSVLIGATNMFIKTLEQIKNVELVNTNTVLTQAAPAVKFITDDSLIHQLYAAISGTIVDRNDRLVDEPELLEKDPYFDGWIYRIIPSELEYEMKLLIPCSSDRT